MKDEFAMIAATTTDLLTRARAAATSTPALWAQLHDAGLIGIGASEEFGGSGGDAAAAAVVVRCSAHFPETADLPVGTTLMLAHWLRAEVGLPVDLSPSAVAHRTVLRLSNDASGGPRLDGSAARLAGACNAQTFLLRARDAAGSEYIVSIGSADSTPGLSVAADPVRKRLGLGDLRCDGVRVAADQLRPLAPTTVNGLDRRANVLMALQLSGMVDAVLALTLRYVRQREQFGRAIADFQMVKDRLAIMAGESATAGAATAGAVDEIDLADRELAVRSAALVTRRAATVVARLAHQLHGTIGITEEHDLHRITTQLWHTSTVNGSLAEAEWALGVLVASRGPDGFWPAVVD